MAETPLPTQEERAAPEQESAAASIGFPIRRFLISFLLLTFASIIGIFLYTGETDFLVPSLKHLWNQPLVITAIVLLLLLEWYTDYLRYYALARGLGIALPFGFGMRIVFANLFFAYLTPGGAFGAPVIIYMMVKRGEKASQAVALALIKPFLLFFLLLIGGSALFWLDDFQITTATRSVLWTSSIVVGCLTAVVGVIIFRPKIAWRSSEKLFARWRGWRNKRGHAETPRIDKWEKGLHTTIEAFSLFGTKGNLKYLLGSLLATALNLIIFLGISVVLLQALGFKISYRTSWLYSYLYYFLIAFAPTPGGSGFAEGGGYLFFKHLGPLPLVSSYVVLWRFLSCYLVIIIGGFLFFQFVQQLQFKDLNKAAAPDQEIPSKGADPHEE